MCVYDVYGGTNMRVLICLLAVAILYSISSFATYSKTIRDSAYIIPLNLSIALISSSLWVYMVRSINDTNKIISASLAWDLIVTLAYVLVPVCIASLDTHGKSLSLQAYIALAISIISVIWFKLCVG